MEHFTYFRVVYKWEAEPVCFPDLCTVQTAEKVLYDLVLQHVQLVTGYIYHHQDHFRMVMEQQLHTESEKQIKAIYVDAPDKTRKGVTKATPSHS